MRKFRKADQIAINKLEQELADSILKSARASKEARDRHDELQAARLERDKAYEAAVTAVNNLLSERLGSAFAGLVTTILCSNADEFIITLGEVAQLHDLAKENGNG